MSYTAEFETVWALYPKRPGANKKNTFKQWALRIKQGATVEEMTAGAKAYAEYCQASDTAGQYIKQPETFFGVSEHYASDWTYEAPAPKVNVQWWATPESIAAKAAEVGVKSLPGEYVSSFKARIEAAIANGGKPPVQQPTRLPVVTREPERTFKPVGMDLLALVGKGARH